VVGDATEFRFPDGNLLVFLYNPFDSVILNRILTTLAATHGNVRIAQLGPGHDVIRKSGLARTLCSGEGPTLYEIHPMSPADNIRGESLVHKLDVPE
jgi:hypothetical protein